jgi:dienelactone hydrolase
MQSAGAVLVYHGLRSSMATLDREARLLAAAGLTAILVDAPHHGARHDDVVGTMPDALSLPGHYVLLRLVREARDEVPALVDHAYSLGHRHVAIAGVSFGAFIALAAATIEPRLAAIVSVLGSPDWAPRDGVTPDDLAAVVSESPLVRYETFAPRPLLLLNGALDDNVRPGPARALVERLRPLYQAGGTGPLVHIEIAGMTHFPSERDWNDIWTSATRFVVLRLRAREARAGIESGALRGGAFLDLLHSVPLVDRDAWADELLGIEQAPPDLPDLPRGAVPYLPCGVEEIVTAVREAPLGADDDLVDLGSGLGRVVILAHLLTGARARGIELQDHLVESARARGAALGLSVSFAHANAANAELDGSVFFLYAPFNGQMLAQVLGRLEEVARRRRIVLCAVGLDLHGVPWLSPRKTSSVSLTLYDSTPQP